MIRAFNIELNNEANSRVEVFEKEMEEMEKKVLEKEVDSKTLEELQNLKEMIEKYKMENESLRLSVEKIGEM